MPASSTSNTADVVARLLADAAGIEDKMVAAIAEQAVLFQQDLLGPQPGAGITPYRTGNLLTSGDVAQVRTRLTFLNDAVPYDIVYGTGRKGFRVTPQLGQPSYASRVHKRGEPRGQYAADVAEAFARRFGPDLVDRLERIGVS